MICPATVLRMSTDYQIVLCTCPDAASAQHIAQHLVKIKLAACINIVSGVSSVYEWKGKIETAQEQLLLIKTHRTHYPALETEIKRLHPYELPEIVAISIENGLFDYLNWLNSCLLSA